MIAITAPMTSRTVQLFLTFSGMVHAFIVSAWGVLQPRFFGLAPMKTNAVRNGYRRGASRSKRVPGIVRLPNYSHSQIRRHFLFPANAIVADCANEVQYKQSRKQV